MKYFRIKNWDKYQHRDHQKTMPWIKLYQNILDDPKMFDLSCHKVGVWCKLMLLCARVGNELSASQPYLRSKLNCSKPVDLALFEELGLIEFFDRADTAPTPRLEERRGEETREEKKRVGIHSLIEVWNKYAVHKHKGLFSNRTNLLVKSLEEFPSLEYWEGIFKSASESKFLNSKEKKWKTTMEWVIAHHIEILEGKFEDYEKPKANISSLNKLR
jgi:hypothetical protein